MNRKLALPLTALAVVAVASATVVAGSSDTMPATGAAMSTRAAAAPAAAAADAGVSPAVLAYVDAVNAADLDALVGAFTADAVITDVSRPISGSDAIRSWADREVIGGSLQVLEVVADRPDGQKLLVHWAPGGSGGWQAHYDFTVSGGRLTAADLQYA